MTTRPDARRLSSLDASFLVLETENAPMHVAGVSIIEGHTPDGPLTFERFRDHVASRLHVSRAFTDVLAEMPLGLGRPYWVPATRFELDRHVERTSLPEPGGVHELRELVAWQMAEALDRDRPLWHMLFVDGLEAVDGVPPGSVAVISRIHHAAIDGMSGSEIVAALFDPTPTPRDLAPSSGTGTGASPARAEPPGRLALARRVGRDLLQPPDVGEITAGVAKRFLGQALRPRFWRAQAPPMPFSAPHTRLNQPITGRRVWSWGSLSLDRVKGIRKALSRDRQATSGAASGVTVNDVLLTLIAGALRRWLDGLDDLPDDPLVAMVPVSIHDQASRSERAGNQVSAMLVSLATEIDDPAERLRHVQASAQGSKTYHAAIGARTLMETAELLPFAVSGQAARLYSRLRLADRHRPIFNLVITNVPGPQMPLYIAGGRLLQHIGAAPIFDGIGMIVPIFSYDGQIAVAVCSCPSILPDPAAITDQLAPSLDDLERSLGIDA